MDFKVAIEQVRKFYIISRTQVSIVYLLKPNNMKLPRQFFFWGEGYKPAVELVIFN